MSKTNFKGGALTDGFRQCFRLVRKQTILKYFRKYLSMTDNTLQFDGYTYQNIYFRETIINFSYLVASKNNFYNLASNWLFDYGDIKILKTFFRISRCILSLNLFNRCFESFIKNLKFFKCKAGPFLSLSKFFFLPYKFSYMKNNVKIVKTK